MRNIMQIRIKLLEPARLPSLSRLISGLCSYATDHVRTDVLKSSQVKQLEWAGPLLLPALPSMHLFKHI